MVIWPVVLITILFLALFLYWALVITEGAYFGAPFVVWLYDLTARRYDRIKCFDEDEEDWYVGLPLWRTIQTVRQPLVLDVASGTARLPLALLRRPLFQGHVIALDRSRSMLRQGQAKLRGFEDHVTLIQQDAMQLSFADETFDAVTCLEALEFLPSPARALGEMVRVLRPGGVLFTTNRVGREARLLPGKALTAGKLKDMLDALPLQAVETRRWQVFYDQVWARKVGCTSLEGNGKLSLDHILRCPHCIESRLSRIPAGWQCATCQRTYPVQNGILTLVKR